ncbi:MAG TPA: alpha/beta hydrolase [Candidatus Acidoferrum sp.]|nr:alpha/beta hydrolase [Candidatus Acidoferrum sp.]
MTSTPILILPGYADSGPDHWQSHWERADPACRRVVQDDWLEPRLADWLATLDRSVRECDSPPVLVAHSLACALVAHWATRAFEGRHGCAGAPRALGGVGGHVGAPHSVKAALLVAPADVDSPVHTPDEVRTFSPMPLARLPFPSIVVASGDDPFVEPSRAEAFAHAWGSRLITLPGAGHINADAGYGPWPDGRTLLQQLL